MARKTWQTERESVNESSFLSVHFTPSTMWLKVWLVAQAQGNLSWTIREAIDCYRLVLAVYGKNWRELIAKYGDGSGDGDGDGGQITYIAGGGAWQPGQQPGSVFSDFTE